jgi:hypothetical protein
VALADVLVTIHARIKLLLGIVEMKRHKAIDPDKRAHETIDIYRLN